MKEIRYYRCEAVITSRRRRDPRCRREASYLAYGRRLCAHHHALLLKGQRLETSGPAPEDHRE